MCCGYPDKLDTDEYLKAPKTNYNLLAPKIDSLGFDEVSIEDAECKNDLSLLALFKNPKVLKCLTAGFDKITKFPVGLQGFSYNFIGDLCWGEKKFYKCGNNSVSLSVKISYL